MPRRRSALLVLPVLAAALAGCGSDARAPVASPDYSLVTPPRVQSAQPLPPPTPAMHADDVRRLRPVIRRWARAVRTGHPDVAARYFALPTIVAQPASGAVEIRRRAVAERFNSSFPCGARLVGTRAQGRFIVGTFVLLSVPGRTCTTPNARVRVGFVFGDRRHPRRFSEWWQAADTTGAAPGPERRPLAPPAGSDLFGP
jgi:hypothetical protein